MDGDAFQILLLLLLGAWAAVDTAAWGQFMVGQPLAAGWLAGVIVGEPLAGLLMGAALQMLWSRLAPVGAAAYPDVGPATVGGVGLLSFWPGPRAPHDGVLDWPVRLGFQRVPEGWQLETSPLAILAGIGLALLAGWAGQRLVARMRHANADLGRVADEAARRGDFGGVERANRLGLLRAAVLGTAQTGAILAAGWLAAIALARVLPAAPIGSNPGVHLFWWIALAALGTSLWSGVRRDWIWIASGLLAGTTLVGIL
ncbi:MAG: PTS sugar transporter subunit IIC [Candidatus Eisenbacteria bacterium]|nr:PTS sugar transporter subunit IIC [Candidatus Eisenbacteria bacterium]